MNKISKGIVAVALATAVVVPVSGTAIYKRFTTTASAETTAPTVSTSAITARTAQTTASVVQTFAVTEKTKAVSENKTEKKTQAVESKNVKQDKEKKSKLLSNKVSVQRWSANSGKMKVNAEKIKLNLNGETRYAYVATIKGAPSYFKSFASLHTTGKSVDTILNIARNQGLTFAVNGEMCNHDKKSFKGFYNSADDSENGTVIKNSKIPQAIAPNPSLTMTKDGKWEYPVSVGPDNAQALINSGVITSVSYTYPVLWNGEPYLVDGGVLAPMWNERDTMADNIQKHFYNDHTLIGQIDANTYVVAISEGFGRGYLCDIMQEMGVQNAFWANGGHCSAMYIQGYGVVNRQNDGGLCLAADIMGF